MGLGVSSNPSRAPLHLHEQLARLVAAAHPPNPNPNPDPNPDPDQLARLIAAHPTLAEHAHFVLVPGPEDATTSSPDVLPRAALPESVAGETLRAAARNCHLATNPARLSLCGQSVVIFREQVRLRLRLRLRVWLRVLGLAP